MNEEQAKERIEELKGYYAHLGSFIGVNIFLIAINILTFGDSGEYWFWYPLLGWGIGLLAHTFMLFAGGKDWEQRKMAELTGWSATQEELERLSDRTDALISILSDVQWDKIDPALLDTKKNLEDARQKVINLHETRDPKTQEEVTRELEKLEEFVTSSKFDFYEKAGSEK